MKNLILQIFLNKYKIIQEIDELQSKTHAEWNEPLIDAKHKEWDRYEHMIDLFFQSINL
jgi:hypothetical protein